MRSSVKRALRAAGLEIRRISDQRLPATTRLRCDGEVFDFWIGNEHAARWWSSGEVRFDAEMRFLKTAAGRGSTVLEVGAHHGMHTIQLARWVGDEGAVHAFELNAENAILLSANVGINRLSRVAVVHAAVSDGPGELQVAGERVADGWRSVRSLSLDGYCEENRIGAVSLVKIDVEGFEGRVLRGARRLLAERPRVALELHLDDLGRYGDTAESVLAEIDLPSYEVEMMVRPDWERTVVVSQLAALPSQGVVNLFLTPRG